ncbi:etoposide-induced protein 2.4-domain-containing protein [Chlamydoabsidia padenii]|nr:etoposide-induced protein 2.4-domain-containing protein [Chlamydoabsidia padenii]
MAYLLSRSTTIKWALLKVVFLNGILWTGSWLLLTMLFTDTSHSIWGWSYITLTGYPLYMVSLYINSIFFDKIAKETIRFTTSRPTYYTPEYNNNNRTTNSPWPSLSSSIYLIIFYGNCALIVSLIRLIPYIGHIIGFPINSIIMAYYCFEYKWIELGWTQEHRLSFVEQHWPYFLGFGLPLTLLTFFLSTLRAGAMFALGFPSFVILASIATMTPSVGNTAPPRLPVFVGLRALNRAAFSLLRIGHTRFFDRLMDQNKKDTVGKLV